MESREEEQEEETLRSFLSDKNTEITKTTNSMTFDTNSITTTVAADSSTATAATTPAAPPDNQTEDEETGEGDSVVIATSSADLPDEKVEVEEGCTEEVSAEDEGEEDEEDEKDKKAREDKKTEEVQDDQEDQDSPVESEEKSLTPTTDRPAPPSSLALSGPRATKKKVLVAPALSLSLGGSESTTSDDFPAGFLSPSPDDEDDTALDFDLDAIETPSDSESLRFPLYDLDLEDDLRRLGVASCRRKPLGSVPKFRSDSQAGSVSGIDESSLGALEREDMVDSQGIRWRCFSTGEPPQESRVNMSVLEPFLRVLSHGGYYGDGMNDIIVFSSCYLPENSLENYQYVMDNLFRFVVGTLELMVAENYVIVYLCAGGQKDKLPGISWLKEWYTTIDRRLRKNLKGFYVVHPTWYIKALITIIKPFISSKFSRKLQFVNSLQELSDFIPTEHVQIPDCVREYDQNLSS
ncbi:BCL2/adenovirus E1B 19 kDa protein-interacting protein 2-like isoform X2 [Amphiprion ocellaris]|nr:BCL2/adenovirus E1B 19 kDa protein-interacting protein 2-like isoform X2 [Amphiprion ocellaris]XP_054873546.1 BCL2/adenovirus E1B 19 kDa protein-interacting protein 2-like isoform X2 [Amphiprion ocellaris]XP_054873547.1 BCL2/adenovirus E1B 19 kDa protein-interacting protein 2-like isoform X2 [Amphiprion ocellaris]